MTTAAAFIIGDEILSGKVHDLNAPVLIDHLRATGVRLASLSFISDDLETIAQEVRKASKAYDAVITSGGVGPTHDDVTIAAVALAFGVDIVRDSELEGMIRTYWGKRLNKAALRLANVPRNSRLLYGSDGLLPLVVYRNVYMFPGIPRLFAAKIGSLSQELSGHLPSQSDLYLNSDESSIATALEEVNEAFRSVKIGSYPQIEEGDHRVWVTLEDEDKKVLADATQHLLRLLPSDEIVRVEN
ncbi:MAG: competence/damage-inducible protein A [bacterium]|nr:competence/damage-inducible protein A [bacterium]